MERETPPELIEQRRQAIINRPPEQSPVFPRLAPPVQDYLREEYQATRPGLSREERKAHSEQAQKKVQVIFKRDDLIEDVTRYGEAVWQELQQVGRK
jgi:hypothetical protein